MQLLMLDGDLHLVSAVRRALQQEGVRVVGAQSMESARERLASLRFAAALLDCDLLDPSELKEFSKLSVILTSSFLDPLGEHRLFRHSRMLRKPFTNSQLLAALGEVSFLGRATATLVDLLRRAHSDRLSLALRAGNAQLFVEDGEVVHAEVLGLSGERALSEILARRPQHLVQIENRQVQRTIHRTFQGLMLDLLRGLEEREERESREDR